MPVGAGAGECVVARDVHQVGQERVARLARRPFELTQGMLSARASRKQSVPDGKRAEHRQALVIVGQGVHQLGEKFKGMSVRFQVHSGAARRRIAGGAWWRGLGDTPGTVRGWGSSWASTPPT